MNPSINGVIVAAGIAIGSAQADSPKAPDVVVTTADQAAAVCGDKGQVWSSTHGFSGCSEVPLRGKPYVLVAQKGADIDPAIDPVKEAQKSQKNRDNLSVTPNGVHYAGNDGSSMSVGPAWALGSTGAQATGTFDGGAYALGAQVVYTKEMQSAFLAAGFKITQDITGVFTVSAASESAAKALGDDRYEGKLQAMGASFGLQVRDAFIRFIHEQGKDAKLLTEHGQTIEISGVDMNTFLRQTTVVTNTTTVTLWDAFTRNTIVGGTTYDVGANGQLTGILGASHDPLHGTEAVVGADAAYYGGDWKANIGAQTQAERISVNGSVMKQLDPHTSIGLMGRYLPAHDGVKAETMVLGAVTYSFESMPHRYTRPDTKQALTPAHQVQAAIANPTLHVQPSQLGQVVRVVTEEPTSSTRDIPNAPKPLSESAIHTQINPDGSVTVTFAARAGWNYEYQVDGSTTAAASTMTKKAKAATGGWTPASGGSFTTAPLGAGGHTIGIHEVNPTSGVTGPTSSVTITLAADNPTEVPGYSVSADQTTATAPVSLFDRDGIQNLTCQVLTLNGVPVGPKVTPTGSACTISGLSPDTAYTFFEEALAKKVNPDGTVTWGLVQNSASFRTAADVVVVTPPTYCELHPQDPSCIL